MIKWVLKNDNILLCKKDNKIMAFVGFNGDKIYYAFGKPSQPGGYIAFEVDSIEKAKSRILEHI